MNDLVGRQIYVCATPEETLTAAAQFLLQRTATSHVNNGTFSLALSGGSTPRGLFRLLAADPYRSQLDWESFRIFWGDERSVPPDHPESNFRMAKEALLDHVPLASHHVFRIEGEQSPEEAAALYEKVLQTQFQLSENLPPRFDLILLGMGPDGHTASLFPGNPVLKESHCLVAAPWVEKFHAHRITLTLPVLNAAKDVLFLVTGKDKAQAAKSVLQGPFDPDRYPAQLVKPHHGNTTWLMDKEAAGLLEKTVLRVWNHGIEE